MTAEQRKESLDRVVRYIIAGATIAVAFTVVRVGMEANTKRIDDHETRLRATERTYADLRADIKIIKAAVTKP